MENIPSNHLKSISPVIEKFHRPALALESQVIHPTLNYVGYFDGLAVHTPSKKVTLIDWKTSKKDKLTLAATFDAPIQIAAYAGALNYDERYPYQVENALIGVVYNDGKMATLIHMDKYQLVKHWLIWLDRLKLYQKRFP